MYTPAAAGRHVACPQQAICVAAIAARAGCRAQQPLPCTATATVAPSASSGFVMSDRAGSTVSSMSSRLLRSSAACCGMTAVSCSGSSGGSDMLINRARLAAVRSTASNIRLRATGTHRPAAVMDIASPAVPEVAGDATVSTSGRGQCIYTPPAGRHGMYDAGGRLMLKNLTLAELEEWCASIGETSKRAVHLWRWMYADGCWMADMHDTLGRQNGFSQGFLDIAGPIATADGGLQLTQVLRSKDGTRKLVFKVTGGEAAGGSVETVLIPVVRHAGLRDRLTVCVSSQVGCAMNCQFCYTGRMGLLGNLSTAQIVEQVVAARRFLQEEGDTTPLTNLVFMGMGEPLHNLESVIAATEILTHHLGLHLGHNKVTVSTVGLLPELRAVAARSSANIALSLHATTDEVRDWIVPVNRRHDLAALFTALRQIFSLSQLDSRTLLIEYVMLAGVNDTADDAQRLVQMLQGVRAKVNLICFNPHSGTRFRASTNTDVQAFRSILIQAGRVCTVRDSRGDDEMSACGQLGDAGNAVKPPPLLEPPLRFAASLVGAGN